MKSNMWLRKENNLSKMLIVAVIIAVIFFVSSCGKAGQNKNSESIRGSDDGAKDKVQIVTTVFPIFDWAKAVVGDDPDFQIILLADSGVDFHSFQPSTEDIMKIKKSNIFLYIGGASDQWVKKIVEDKESYKGVNISMVSALGDRLKAEDKESDGMNYSHEHSDAETGEEIDEHLWLSLKNAKIFVEKICQTLSEMYPEKKERFNGNCTEYIQSIDELDEQYREAVDKGDHKAVVVGDRFPFRYLFDDYSLEYFAAFPGCSSESEGSFEKIIWLAQKVDQLNIKKIIAIEDSKQTICDSIIENTEKKDQSAVVMNSMQQVSMKDIEGGENYLKIMEENLGALKEALN